MRIILTWVDQLRRTTPEGLPGFCAALVAQFQDLATAANTWAKKDHRSDGTHRVVRLGAHEPEDLTATVGQLTLYWDGTNLKTVKPDGTVGTVTIT